MDKVSEGEDTGPKPISGHVDTMIVPFSIKEEQEAYLKDHEYAKQTKGIGPPTDIPFHNKEGEAYFADHNSIGVPIITSVFSVHPKHKEVTVSKESPTGGDGGMNRGWDVEESLKCPDKATASYTWSGEASVKVLQTSENGTRSKSHQCSQNNLERRRAETTQCGSDFSKLTYSNACHEKPKAEDLNIHNESESNLSNEEYLARQSNTLQRWEVCGDTVCEKTSTWKLVSMRHQKSHSGRGGKVYYCTACQKCFSQSSQYRRHQKTHTKERDYQCTDCVKSFMLKHHLVEHMRIHSGVKPYPCTLCSKCFVHKASLNEHIRRDVCKREAQRRAFYSKGATLLM